MTVEVEGRSQWPRGLRRVSAAARLLGLLIRIPPGAWIFVLSVVCCHVEVLGRSLVQRSPTACSVSECDSEASIFGGLELLGYVAPLKKNRNGKTEFCH